MISDGTFFIQAYFTKEAFATCHQGKAVNINITDLQEGLIAISKWECELVTANSAEEFTSYGGIEMRIIVHEFKVKLGEHVNMSKYPANLYRDDDVKTHFLSFIAQQRHESIVKAAADDIDFFTGSKPKGAPAIAALTTRKLNTLNISAADSALSLFQLAADDDIYQDFHFLKHPLKASVLTMQEIYVQEKGAEALRSTNITYLHHQRKEEPNLERKGFRLRNAGEADSDSQEALEISSDKKTSKKDNSKGKVKKSLKVDKEIKVTTTIVKGRNRSAKKDNKKAPASKKGSKSASVKKSKSKIVIKPSSKKVEKKAAAQIATPSKAKVSATPMKSTTPIKSATPMKSAVTPTSK